MHYHLTAKQIMTMPGVTLIDNLSEFFILLSYIILEAKNFSYGFINTKSLE